MASAKLSNQDQKDLEKYTKYLVYKYAQIVVQSRLGDRIKSRSSPFAVSSDWFNLAVSDIPEITSETKKVYSGGSLFTGDPLCIEISLKTVEGETMILETWWLTTTEQTDPTAKISYTVYSRMGIMLKSLICVTRVTHGYQLSRKQGAESFVMCYRLYRGEPYFGLGDGYRTNKVGNVPTPLGTIVLNMAYRTRMLISPQQSLCRDVQFEVKDDHFTENSPKQIPAPHKYCPPATRVHRNSFGEDGFIFPVDPPDGGGDGCTCGAKYSPGPTHKHHTAHQHTAPQKPSLDKLGAFAPQRQNGWDNSPKDDVPFCSLLRHNDNLNANTTTTENGTNTPCKHHRQSNGVADESSESRENGDSECLSKSEGSASNRSSGSHGSAPEDYVMVQLKTPFGGADSQWDLGGFYKACQGPPPLRMLEETSTYQDTLNGITDQLATFEACAKDFDEFLNSFQPTEG